MHNGQIMGEFLILKEYWHKFSVRISRRSFHIKLIPLSTQTLRIALITC